MAASNRHSIMGKLAVIAWSIGLVPRNALVSTNEYFSEATDGWLVPTHSPVSAVIRHCVAVQRLGL